MLILFWSNDSFHVDRYSLGVPTSFMMGISLGKQKKGPSKPYPQEDGLGTTQRYFDGWMQKLEE